MKKIFTFTFSVLFYFVFTAIVFAAEVRVVEHVFAAKDNYIRDTISNQGSDTKIRLQGWSYGDRILIGFTLPSVQNATIENIDMNLTLHASTGYELETSVFKLTRSDWTKLGSTWYSYNGSNNWASPGTDFESPAIVSQTVNYGQPTGTVITYNLQGGGATNPTAYSMGDSVDLMLDYLSTNPGYGDYCSAEHSTSEYRPYLETVYLCDESVAPYVGGNVISVTPTSGSNQSLVVTGEMRFDNMNIDFNDNGVTEHLLAGYDTNGQIVVSIQDPIEITNKIIREFVAFPTGWILVIVRMTPDSNVSVMANDGSGNTQIRYFDSTDGTELTGNNAMP